jgi:hypothetical protein
MKKAIFFFFLLSSMQIFAQHYAVQSIPDSLKKNAEAVKRLQEIVVEIKSPSKAIVTEHVVYTILDENGDGYAQYIGEYDKLVSLNSAVARLFDANGKELKHIKKNDMEDKSGTGESNLITDTRYKENNFYYRNYPYTVEYEDENELNGIRDFDDWFPQSSPKLSVEYSKYTIIAPSDYEVRYKSFHYDKQPIISEANGKKTYTWEIRNLTAKQIEPLAPRWSEIAPRVIMAPSKFEVQGYPGDMSSWKGFGQFMYQLLRDRDILPADIKQKVHELTDKLTNENKKIEVLYDFLQKNTRYVSVQLGIGGWQPFDASYVAQKRYGDCKALSNYMVALLKEAGIKAASVIIKSGRSASPVLTDFSNPNFNHVIACVPHQQDTVWLECTSSILPAGYLSAFTANRYALMVDENGGTLVHTPKYSYKDNLQSRKTTATLSDEGTLTATVRTLYKAEQQDELEDVINYLPKEKILEHLKANIDLPTFDIQKFDFVEDRKSIPPSIYETLEITANNYAQVSGKRVFIVPNILTRTYRKLKEDSSRQYSVEISDEFKDVDTVEIKIPLGYQPEAMPKDIRIENQYGKYQCTTKVEGDKIIYYRLREQYSGSFAASKYAEIQQFYDKIYKADRAKIVMVKKE